MLYDSFLILAVLFLASAIAMIFNHGEAIESNAWFSLYLLLTVFTFYAWFWQKTGQTHPYNQYFTPGDERKQG